MSARVGSWHEFAVAHSVYGRFTLTTDASAAEVKAKADTQSTTMPQRRYGFGRKWPNASTKAAPTNGDRKNEQTKKQISFLL